MNKKTNYLILTIALCFLLAFVVYPLSFVYAYPIQNGGSILPTTPPTTTDSTPTDPTDPIDPWFFGDQACVTCRLINDTAVKEEDLGNRPVSFDTEIGDEFVGDSGIT